MKLGRKQVRRQVRIIPRLEFVDQQLTSFSGLILFQVLFSKIKLKDRLKECFQHIEVERSYCHAVVVLGLVVHLLLGYRKLRDVRYYRDDPIVCRVLGLNQMPGVSTISRVLNDMDKHSVELQRDLCRELIVERITALGIARLTLDFDGSVLGTSRWAEGAAIGFNKGKKGQRSYYPLFCTVAQTGQVFDFLHRSGNVHDSRGAQEFIPDCVKGFRDSLPRIQIEARMDSAFFSDAIVSLLHRIGVEFTVTVPFERFVQLKERIEGRKIWWRLNKELSYFELKWKPKSWNRRARLIVVRKRVKTQYREPIQLDLFIPKEYDYEYKVIVTNKTISARKVVVFHDGRGAQEAIFGELKSEGQMDYIPCRSLAGNQTYMLATVLAHNLNRELQMEVQPRSRKTTEKRAPLWRFERLNTVRRKLIQLAGRLIRPQGKLTLRLSTNESVRNELLTYLAALQPA